MRSRQRVLTFFFCGAFVMARLLGLHLHLASGSAPSAPVPAASTHLHEHLLVVAMDLGAQHDLEHSDSGPVDLSSPHNMAGKLPSLTLAALLAAVIGLLVMPLFPRGGAPPPLRVPVTLRPPYLLPPSHAPPRPR